MLLKRKLEIEMHVEGSLLSELMVPPAKTLSKSI